MTTMETMSVRLSFPLWSGYDLNESFKRASSVYTVKTLGEARIFSATFAALTAPNPRLFPRMVTVSSRTKSVVTAAGTLPVRIASMTS